MTTRNPLTFEREDQIDEIMKSSRLHDSEKLSVVKIVIKDLRNINNTPTFVFPL